MCLKILAHQIAENISLYFTEKIVLAITVWNQKIMRTYEEDNSVSFAGAADKKLSDNSNC